jgi:predicted phosphodiesterase/predicted transcriptional regulator
MEWEKELVKRLYEYLEKNDGRGSLSQISKHFGISRTYVLEIGEQISDLYPKKEVLLNRKKNEILLVNKGERLDEYVPLSERMKKFRVGLACEAHIGSKYFSSTLLHTAWKVFDEFDTNLIIFAGDMFAGKEYKRKMGEIFLNSPEEQIEFASAIFPYSALGLRTHAIAGPQDIWYKGRETLNLVSELAERRKDIVYEGTDQHDFPIYATSVTIRAMNPVVMEKNPVGKTYDLQKKMENVEVRKGEKLIIALGGYHTYSVIPAYGNVEYGILLPSLIPQTPSLLRKEINPTIGVVILELLLSKRDEKRGVRNLEGVKSIFIPLKQYWVERDYLKEPSYEGLSEVERKVLEIIFKEGECSLGKISRELRLDKDTIKTAIESLNKKLRERKSEIRFDGRSSKYIYIGPYSLEKEKIPEKIDFGKDTLKLLAISDTHLNSKYQNLNLLKELYKQAEKFDAILHLGDLSDGLPVKGYKGHVQEVVITSITTLLEWLSETYPKTRVPTFLIGGNHDDWAYTEEGLDMLKELCRRREDLHYLGRGFGVVEIKGVSIALHHPRKGAPRTLGYDLQNFTKYLQRFGDFKLNLFGNYHKAAILIIDDKIGCLVPTLKSPDPFFIGKGLPDWVGAWDIELGISDGEVKMITSSYINLRDKCNPNDYKQILEWLKKKEETMFSRVVYEKPKVEERKVTQKKIYDFL